MTATLAKPGRRSLATEKQELFLERPLSRYSAVSIALHWTIAALILTNIVLAWTWPDKGPLKGQMLMWHKSFGITVLALSLIRLAWRLTHRPPSFPVDTPDWQKWAAHLVHWGFYVVMIGLPLTGWLMISTGTRPTLLYGAVPLPLIGPVHGLPAAQSHGLHDIFENGHGLLAKLTYALFALHILAALQHQFIQRDRLLSRMGFGRAAPRGASG